MPSTPFPYTGNQIEDFMRNAIAMFRDLYENRCGGAEVGDVFQIAGDTLELKIKSGSGLQKTNGELDIDIDTIGTNGAVMKSHYTAKGDILTATGNAATSILPVGSNTNVIKADSSVARGIKWAAVAASEVVNTPAGTIAATDVQTALNELDTEKAPKANPVFTGTVNLGGDTNYINIADSDGGITWGGTFKKKLAMRPAFVAGRVGGLSKPTPVDIGMFSGYSMPIYNSDQEELFWRLSVPGRWDGTTNPTYNLIVCLSAAETEGDDFRFQVSWNYTDGTTGVIPATSIQDLTADGDCTSGHTAQYSVFKLQYTIDVDYGGADLDVGDILSARIRRIASGGTEVSNEIIVLDHWIDFTIDKAYKTV